MYAMVMAAKKAKAKAKKRSGDEGGPATLSPPKKSRRIVASSGSGGKVDEGGHKDGTQAKPRVKKEKKTRTEAADWSDEEDADADDIYGVDNDGRTKEETWHVIKGGVKYRDLVIGVG
jgi:hypothetical protein